MRLLSIAKIPVANPSFMFLTSWIASYLRYVGSMPEHKAAAAAIA
jgi:hypothetical protein